MESGKFYFYLMRFRNASLAELVYRIKHFFFIKKLKIAHSKKKNLIVVPRINRRNIVDLQLPAIRGETNERLVKKILNGKLFTLNAELDAIMKFENRWRNAFFSKIKTTDQDPDLRSVWEPARLQHIAILLNYIFQNENPELLECVLQFSKKNILKWIDENTFLYGPHYISAMECGLRIPLLLYCLKFLDNLNDGEFQIILDTLYRHAWWISNRLSLYSSRGNHTIVEASGLIFGGAAFRYTVEGRTWLAKGYTLLNKELGHQILKDGGPVEQSLNYHRFILDLYWFTIDFLKKNNFYDCDGFEKRLIKAEHFITAFKDARGRLPSIGDSDAGHIIAPGIYPCRVHPSSKNRKIQTFTQSGYTIYNDNKVILTFDHGPLGMAPLYNHGHADALSVTLAMEGKPVLVDPGTYRYNGAPQWRRYFKGTRAHNTITIDGCDQSIQETGFIWSYPYNTKLLGIKKNDEQFLINAEHDGYTRLKKPVWHRRDILFFDEFCLLIKDSFKGKGLHEFEINFHLHPEASLTKQNDWWQIKNDGACVYLRLIDNGDFSIIRGLRDPIHGWYSPCYGIKRECNVMSCRKKGSPNEISFVSAICTKALIDMKEIQDKFIYFD